MSDPDPLVALFAQQGTPVDDVVRAVQARRYPLLGGNYSAFARLILLARTDFEVQVWSAWSGPTPKRLLRRHPAASLRVMPGGRRYVHVVLGTEQLWVDRRDVERLSSWA